MTTIAVILLLVTGGVLIAEAIYWRRQRKVCEKYPFYTLRDEVIWRIAQTETPHPDLLAIYEWINTAINELNRFDFRYFAKSIVELVHKVAEKGYACNFDPNRDWIPDGPNHAKIDPLLRKIAEQVLVTAKRNSPLIRIAVSPIGSAAIATFTVPVALAKLARKHPDLFKRLEASREYAKAQRALVQAA